MSWRQQAMKGVEDCEKPGGMVKRVLIPAERFAAEARFTGSSGAFARAKSE
jgi:hypothetical protein